MFHQRRPLSDCPNIPATGGKMLLGSAAKSQPRNLKINKKPNQPSTDLLFCLVYPGSYKDKTKKNMSLNGG